MTFPSPEIIEDACRIVYEAMQPAPQYRWPLLCQRAGCEVWLKHENHGPLGAFKIRSALVYFRRLREAGGAERVAVTATRGNFGQAVAFAARREGMEAVVYVPHGNSPGKNRAMQSLGDAIAGRPSGGARRGFRRGAAGSAALGEGGEPPLRAGIPRAAGGGGGPLFVGTVSRGGANRRGVRAHRHGVGDSRNVRGAPGAGAEDGNRRGGVGARAGVLRIVCAP